MILRSSYFVKLVTRVAEGGLYSFLTDRKKGYVRRNFPTHKKEGL